MENPYQVQFGKKITKLRESWQWNRTDLARKVGVSMPYISQIENGQKLPTEKRLEELISLLIQIPPDNQSLCDELRQTWYKAKTFDEEQYLKQHSRSQVTINSPSAQYHPQTNDEMIMLSPAQKIGFTKVPLISWVQAGSLCEAMDEYPVGQGQDWVFTNIKGSNLFALEVHGDSMEPEFQEGDTIIVDPDVEPNHNDFVVVRDNHEDTATFKQLRKSGERIILHPLNPKYEDIFPDGEDRWTICGKVVQQLKNR